MDSPDLASNKAKSEPINDNSNGIGITPHEFKSEPIPESLRSSTSNISTNSSSIKKDQKDEETKLSPELNPDAPENDESDELEELRK